MSVAEAILDLEELLQELDPTAPCGEDLEYDAEFGAMERAAEGKPEQQFGDTIVEAEEPEWRDVKKHALELMGRTKDLRVTTYLCQSLLAVDGLSAFVEGLEFLASLLGSYWDHLHPLLDPDDDNDPTIRVNSLAPLCSSSSTLRLLKRTPLVESRMVGRFNLQQIQQANSDGGNGNEADSDSDEASTEAKPDKAMIAAAFQDVDLEVLQIQRDVVQKAIEQTKQIEASLTDYVGAGNAFSFSPLTGMLGMILAIYHDALSRRGVSTGPEMGDASGAAMESTGAAASANGTSSVVGLHGEITSREDVIKAIDKTLDYFRRHEPSSPLPLLLKRAKRLANLDFMEIIKDLAPEGVSQVQLISGCDGDSSDD